MGRRDSERRRRRFPARLELLAAVVCGAAALLAVSCVSLPRELSSPVSVPDTFGARGTAPLPELWWTAFGDEVLDALVDEALGGNLGLRTVRDRLAQSTASAAKSGASLRPSASGSGSLSRQVRDTTGRTYATDIALGLAASYELDLWGRLRATRDAAQLDTAATSEDLQAAAISLTAEIARTWYRLVERSGQLRLVDDQVRTNKDYLDVITLRFRRGQASATDVLQQRQLVHATESERILVRSAISVLEHQLAVLLGRTPDGWRAVDMPSALPSLPSLPDTGVPLDWLRRRPDLRAAELRLHAADRRLAAAVADRWPTLGVSVSASTDASRAEDLFENWLASAAASLAAPLLDGGLRRAEVKRSRAVVSEALHGYGQSVLSALGEVEDALVRESRQREYVASLEFQLVLSAQATQQTRESYIRSGEQFTRYLTTLMSHQRLQRSLLDAQRQHVEYRIGLYRALAGGWALEGGRR